MAIAEEVCEITMTVSAVTAADAEALAVKEQRPVGQIFDEAFRAYRSRLFWEELERIRAAVPPTPYTEEDIPRLIKEVRAEMAAERPVAEGDTGR